jgi:hypothetical protein
MESSSRAGGTPKTGKRNLFLTAVFISCLVMFSAAAGAAPSQPKALTGSATDFKRAQFDTSTRITNKWLPLKPGPQFVYEGFVHHGCLIILLRYL